MGGERCDKCKKEAAELYTRGRKRANSEITVQDRIQELSTQLEDARKTGAALSDQLKEAKFIKELEKELSSQKAVNRTLGMQIDALKDGKESYSLAPD